MNTNFSTTLSTPHISPETIRREALKEVFWAPVTWVPFVPAMGVVAFAPLPFWGNVVLLGAVATFVGGTWVHSWPRLVRVVEGRLLQKHSKTVEEGFEILLKKLVARGMRQHELALAKAEDILHTMFELNAGQPSEQSIRIETVAREVFTQMIAETETAIAERVSTNPDIHLESLFSSLQTLEQSLYTMEQQARLLDKISHQKPEDRLAELRVQLQQENSIAQNVLNRLENDTHQL